MSLSSQQTKHSTTLLAGSECFWYQPDPAAASYPHISPYSYCAGNPVRYTDPSGMVIEYIDDNGDTKFIRDLISKLRENRMFDDVFSLIDSSKDTYTIGLGNIIIAGTDKKAAACFDRKEKAITFSEDLSGDKVLSLLSVCEELYHVYQTQVDEQGWHVPYLLTNSSFFVNEEYEAKTFAVIEYISVGTDGCMEEDFKQIHDAVLESFMDVTNTKFVYNSSFPQWYVGNGAEFLKYHKSNPVVAYRRPILFMPQRLINVLTR